MTGFRHIGPVAMSIIGRQEEAARRATRSLLNVRQGLLAELRHFERAIEKVDRQLDALDPEWRRKVADSEERQHLQTAAASLDDRLAQAEG